MHLQVAERPAAYNLRHLPPHADDNGWKIRHAAAVRNPRSNEGPIVVSIQAWIDMALQHRAQFDRAIGQDGYASHPWAAIGVALRSLLNMSWGSRLDMGTLDAVLVETLEAEGWDVDMGEWKEGRES
jgi:hypothetical protein